MNEHRWLCESENFKVYSIYDNTYLKDKRGSRILNKFEKEDKFIQWIYGEPNGAIIMPNEDIVIIVGSGIYIYDINKKELLEFFNEPNNIKWIDTVYQNHQDNSSNEFRVVMCNEQNQLREFKYQIEESKLKEIK